MGMRFQFTARVKDLGYATNAEVEKQALSYLKDPDMGIFSLSIGTWEATLIKGRDVLLWEATVEAQVNEGRGLLDHGTDQAIVFHK